MFSEIRFFLKLLVLFLFSAVNCHATYIQVYSTTDNGGLSWTGNTLGLNKALNTNLPGTQGAIGAFISTNLGLQVPGFPVGTTLDWTLNSSNAELDIPEGSTILHAELIWSGSYGFDPAISGPVLNSSVNFKTPDNIIHTVNYNPATAQFRVEVGTRGFYVRSADVTSLVTAGGLYEVGHVPGTVVPQENNSNCAGWTLAVAYSNPRCLTSNLNLYVACEASGAAPAIVTGFHAPNNGVVSSRLFVSALEGDPQSNGDRLLVKENLPLNITNDRVSGSNNPANNFFASQINTLLPLTTEINSNKIIATGSSQLDTRGSFGLENSLASGTGISGARQGYDITSIDISNKIVNGQTQLYIQGTTTGEAYTLNALGVAIEVEAPIIQSVKESTLCTVDIGSTTHFTMTFTNVGTSTASNVIFTDPLAPQLTFDPLSFTIDGVYFPGANLVAGVPLGDLLGGQSVVIEFDADITSLNPPLEFTNSARVDYSFIPFVGSPPLALYSLTNDVELSSSDLPDPVANPDFGITIVNTPFNGESVLSNDTGVDFDVVSFDPITVQGGTVFMQVDGTYVYTPPPNFSGQDQFNYTISDPLNQTATATVFLTVLPLAIGDSATVAANTPLNQTVSILNNDLGTAPLTVNVGLSDTVTSGGGSVVIQPNGQYLYTPLTNFTGTDTFMYTMQDSSGNMNDAIVTIEVLGAATDDEGTTPANTTLNGSTVFSNDVGSGFTLISYQNPSTNLGSVSMSFVTGNYEYIPPLNFSGYDTFDYTVEDSFGNPSSATVTILVTPVAANDFTSTLVNTVLLGPSVLSNDAGLNLAISAYDFSTTHGGVVIMDNVLGTYTYTPPANFVGVDTFTYTLVDGEGSTSIATVSITLLAAGAGDAATTYTNTTLAGPSVLNNGSGNIFQITGFQSPTANGGLVTMNADGTYQYVPPPGFSGYDTFTFTATSSDGGIIEPTVTITVLPLVLNEEISTSQNVAVTGLNVLDNDAGTGLTVVGFQATSVQGGAVFVFPDGSYTYTPPLNYVGADSFYYTVQDSSGLTVTGFVSITINAVGIPGDFVGSVKKCQLIDRTRYQLRSSWTVQLDAVSYRIYFNGEIVSEIAATAPLQFNKSLSSKKSAKQFELAAVNSAGVESARVRIRIVND